MPNWPKFRNNNNNKNQSNNRRNRQVHKKCTPWNRLSYIFFSYSNKYTIFSVIFLGNVFWRTTSLISHRFSISLNAFSLQWMQLGMRKCDTNEKKETQMPNDYLIFCFLLLMVIDYFKPLSTQPSTNYENVSRVRNVLRHLYIDMSSFLLNLKSKNIKARAFVSDRIKIIVALIWILKTKATSINMFNVSQLDCQKLQLFSHLSISPLNRNETFFHTSFLCVCIIAIFWVEIVGVFIFAPH